MTHPMTMTMARRTLAATALLVALTLPGSGFAQAVPGETDLRALRYYIAQNETEAVSAELRRLQAAFPGWTPPTDLRQLQQTGPTGEIDDIYARITSGDLGGAREMLTATRAKYPSWIPPADMLSQLDLAESQLAFDAAITAGNGAAAIKVATATPMLLRCDRVNNTWQLAMLQAASGNKAGAYVAYRQIVLACTNIPEIVATIEKADAVATTDQMATLFATARQRFAANARKFDAIETRIMAGRGVVVALPAARVAGVQAPPAPMAQAVPQVTAKPATGTAMAEAMATAQSGTAPAANVPRVGTIKLSGLPRSGDGRIGQTRIAAKSGNYPSCLAMSAQPRSLDIVYERAWCAYNLERPLEALAYFSAAANGGLGNDINRDARFGMALSFLKRNMTDNASQIAASTDLTLEQRRTVESIILDQRGVRAFQQKDFSHAIGYFDAKETMDNGLRRDLALMRAYSYKNLGNTAEAHIQFVKLDNELSTDETRAGVKNTFP